MKEEFTINKPHIVDQFGIFLNQVLKPNTAENQQTTNDAPVIYTISENDLKDCLVKLGGMVQERERSNFEQYTMFYENLLRQQHQLLYLREREVLSLTDIIEKKVAETNVEVQCQMADACYDMIMGEFWFLGIKMEISLWFIGSEFFSCVCLNFIRGHSTTSSNHRNER